VITPVKQKRYKRPRIVPVLADLCTILGTLIVLAEIFYRLTCGVALR
jgi:hypothetical protein